jgi:23S rRNA (guanosine2251-2'-O)-methyltransferase
MSRHAEYEYVFGIHATRQILEHNFESVVEIWLQQGGNEYKFADLSRFIQQQGLTIQHVPKKTLDKLTNSAVHQGIVIRCRVSTNKTQPTLESCLAELTTPPLLLVLDGIKDPHNLGACLRTADAAGVHAVIVPKDRACSISATVRKVACGGAETIPFIQVTNLATTLRWLKTQGIWLVGTTEKSQTSLFTTPLQGAIAFVLGAEGSGLRRLTQENCDTLVHIPMLGTVESLNVSVATGICLYEAVRQRHPDNKRR